MRAWQNWLDEMTDEMLRNLPKPRLSSGPRL